jgi:hypothetical protein
MREAIPAEAAELNQRTHREQSDAIRALIKNPDVWYHINPGDAPGRNLQDQMEKLEEEGYFHGFRIVIHHIPAHKEGGFFAIFRI